MVEGSDTAGALKNSLEAQQIFARASNHDYEWLAWVVAARASRSAGDMQKAREYASRAESLLAGLQPQWGDENYNKYLSRPDVQVAKKHLSEIISEKT
jgi:hypothetical protein